MLLFYLKIVIQVEKPFEILAKQKDLRANSVSEKMLINFYSLCQICSTLSF